METTINTEKLVAAIIKQWELNAEMMGGKVLVSYENKIVAYSVNDNELSILTFDEVIKDFIELQL